MNLRESFYGHSSQLAQTPANLNINYRLGVQNRFLTDLEVTARPITGIAFTLGANNIFNTYPNRYPYYIRQQQYALSSTAYIQPYPTFSPIGVNGGYY